MNAPMIHGRRRTITASKMLQAIGDDLSQIRADDTLTWADIGRVLGKSEDQAAKYADATAEMPVSAYLFARREWGTRITARVQMMVDRDRPQVRDNEVLPDVLGCAKGLSEALADGRICTRDLNINRKEIEEAISGLYSVLAKLPEDA